MRYVTVSGTYYEQGRQHGAALTDEIRRIIGEVLRPDSWDKNRVDRYLDLLEANMLRCCPGLVKEMQGIADGAGISYRQILTYNCLADIWQVNAFCTNVSFQYTPDGPAIGKTNDIGKDSQHYHALFRREGGEGGPHLLATWPGTVWANCFVNGRGLAFGAASIVKRVRNEEGIPSNILLRWLSDSSGNVPEAVECLKGTPVMHHPANITVADGEGRLAVIEKSPDGCEIREPDNNGVLFATNHFCTPGLGGTDAPEANLKQNSLARFVNLGRLTGGGEQSIERLQAILSDHTQPGAVCQHGHQEMWTSVAYIAVPRTLSLYFCYGRPCETEFEKYVL